MNPQFTGHPAHNVAEYADTFVDADRAKAALADELKSIVDQETHIETLQGTRDKYVQVQESIGTLFKEPSYQPSGSNYETYGAATHRVIMYDNMLEQARTNMNSIHKTVKALEDKITELESQE